MTKPPDLTSAKQNDPPQNEGERTRYEPQPGPPIVRAVVEIPEAILQEYRANQQRQRTDENSNRRIARWAVVGAWFYAVITLFILIANRCLVIATSKQASVADEAMRVSNRP